MLRSRLMNGFLTIGLLASCPGFVCAQQEVATVVTAAKAADNLTWAEKTFSKLEYDFGTVARGAETKALITVTNPYLEPITISSATTTCGCVKASLPEKRTLLTNESLQIEMKLDTVKFMRKRESNLDVSMTFNGVNFKSVRIPCKAYIRTDVVMEPGCADFGSLELGKGGEKCVKISYAGRDGWRINEVRCTNPNVTTELKEISRTPTTVVYDLIVKVDPQAAEGNLRDQLALVTNDESNPLVPLTVQATLEPDIVVTPGTLPLGNMQPGVAKRFSVVVKGRRAFEISSIKCESDRQCFQVAMPKGQKTVHVMPLVITPPLSETGELKETFLITINGREQPVKFNAEGKVEVAQAASASK